MLHMFMYRTISLLFILLNKKNANVLLNHFITVLAFILQ